MKREHLYWILQVTIRESSDPQALI